jgi:hypothetical protein
VAVSILSHCTEVSLTALVDVFVFVLHLGAVLVTRDSFYDDRKPNAVII